MMALPRYVLRIPGAGHVLEGHVLALLESVTTAIDAFSASPFRISYAAGPDGRSLPDRRRIQASTRLDLLRYACASSLENILDVPAAQTVPDANGAVLSRADEVTSVGCECHAGDPPAVVAA